MLNIFLVCLLAVVAAVTLWWAFTTIRHIQFQKEFNAFPLESVGKLWKKAQFVPEDAKERESLYLYRDFLSKFDGDNARYPLMVKNGGVRCMSRAEYDKLCELKPQRPVSVLTCLLTVIYSGLAIGFNTKNLFFGIVLALVMPAIQIVMALYIHRFNRDKNRYRENLFTQLKDTSPDFLRVTKAFILRDAYPQAFGSDVSPKFVSVGELTAEQITTAQDYIARQAAAETQIVLKPVNTPAPVMDIPATTADKAPEVATEPVTDTAELISDTDTLPAPTPDSDLTTTTATPEVTAAMTPEMAPTEVAEPTNTTENAPTRPAFLNLHDDDDDITATTDTAITPTPDTNTTAADTITDVTTDTTATTSETTTPDTVTTDTTATAEAPAPADNDFSLEAIGLALDAEMAKRRAAGVK